MDEANGHLQRMCLPLCDPANWSKINDRYKALCLPRGYSNIIKKYAKGSVPAGAMDFLRFHNFDLFFAIEENLRGYLKEEDFSATDGALSIHKQPFARLAINVLLIHQVNKQEIKDLVGMGHKIDVSVKALEIYEKFFWDTKIMTPADWAAIVPKFQYKETEILYAGLTNKLEDVKFLLKVPTKIEYSDFLKTALETANYKFNYYSNLNTEQADKNARAWGSTALAAGEKYERYKGAGGADIFQQFQMEFEFEQNQIPVADETLAKSVVMDHAAKKQSAQEKIGDDLENPATFDPENF